MPVLLLPLLFQLHSHRRSIRSVIWWKKKREKFCQVVDFFWCTEAVEFRREYVLIVVWCRIAYTARYIVLLLLRARCRRYLVGACAGYARTSCWLSSWSSYLRIAYRCTRRRSFHRPVIAFSGDPVLVLCSRLAYLCGSLVWAVPKSLRFKGFFGEGSRMLDVGRIVRRENGLRLNALCLRTQTGWKHLARPSAGETQTR